MRRILALVSLALLTLPTDAMADWRMVPSDNFRVIGDVGAGQLRGVALRLEQFREVISLLNPGAIPDKDSTPVVVFVFGSDRSYRPFMPRVDGRVIRVAGMFQPGQDVNYVALSLDAGAQAY